MIQRPASAKAPPGKRKRPNLAEGAPSKSSHVKDNSSDVTAQSAGSHVAEPAQTTDSAVQGGLGELPQPPHVHARAHERTQHTRAGGEEGRAWGSDLSNSPNSPNSPSLTPDHRQELLDSAIPLETAAKHGVYSAMTAEELPYWAADRVGSVEGALPALVYPMREVDGRETGQVKPQKDTVLDYDCDPDDPRYVKYLSPVNGL